MSKINCLPSSSKQSLERLKLSISIIVFLIIAFLALSLSHFRASPIHAQNQAQDLQSAASDTPVDIDNRIYAAFYSTKKGMKSTLVLNSAVDRALTAQVTLYDKRGRTLVIPEISLGAHATRFYNVAKWVKAFGTGNFSEGSLEVSFHGPFMGIAAQLVVADEQRSLSFDVPLTGEKDFASSQLDSLWWSLDEKTLAQVFVANTKTNVTTVTPTFYLEGEAIQAEPVVLGPHESATLDVKQMIDKLTTRNKDIGGISLRHDNQLGALAVAGALTDKKRGFSSTLRFADASTQRSKRLHGAHLLIGKARADSGLASRGNYVPQVIVRNIASTPVEVKVKVLYTENKISNTVNIAPVLLSPNEIRKLDMSAAVQAVGTAEITDAGLELEHTGQPGSIVISAASIEQSKDQVFDMPLKDPNSPGNSGGNYPWKIDGDNRAVVHLKNIDPVTDGKPRQFGMMFMFEGGDYVFPVQLIEAGQTATVDIKRIRDGQIPDSRGKVIPFNVTQGKAAWIGRGTRGEYVGRLVQYNPTLATSFSFSCPSSCQCNPSYESGFITPGSATGAAGDTINLRAFERLSTCGGGVIICDVTSITTFESSSPSVVFISGSTAILQGGGTAFISATWDTTVSQFGLECGPISVRKGEAAVITPQFDEFPGCCNNIPTTGFASSNITSQSGSIAALVAVGKDQTNTVQVTLNPSPASSNVTLTLSVTSGSGSAQFTSNNSTTLTVNQTTNVEIKGITESSTQNNIRLQAKLGSKTLATRDFTVIKVVLSLRTSGAIPTDNAGRATYSGVLGSTNLGTFKSSGTGNQIWRNGVEIVGTVTPSNFTGSITLEREVVAFRSYSEMVQTGSGGPFGDTSDASLRDDNPQSGSSGGKVYDLDAPGIGSTAGAPVGRILRTRVNFRQWASVGGTRVSGDMEWFSRISIMKTVAGDVLQTDVGGDNAAGTGTTNLTWNLL